MNKTCFVIMPYGKKQDIDGNLVDFDAIYRRLIVKAVKGIAELEVLRCDDIEKPGWIHQRMMQRILEDQVAIVDTSTLNANVFYELGVRHALRRSVTVLLHRKGTSWPFNITGLSSIGYGDSKDEMKDAVRKLQTYIQNALDDPENVDSLVHLAVPNLRIEHGLARVPKRITRFSAEKYRLFNQPTKQIGFVTGDYEVIKIGDIWVTSENTDMQMDSYYGKSTSATVRYLGACKDSVSGNVIEDTIAAELAAAMGDQKSVAPGAVVVTGPGSLKGNNVKWIFHAAAVTGQFREGYRPIEQIERCVTNVLAKADSVDLQGEPPRSILMPIFGTGPAGGDLRSHLRRFLETAVAYLETNPESNLDTVYFYVWTDVDLEICREVARACEGLCSPTAAEGATVGN